MKLNISNLLRRVNDELEKFSINDIEALSTEEKLETLDKLFNIYEKATKLEEELKEDENNE